MLLITRFWDMFISQKKQTEISEMMEIMKRFPLKESKRKIWKNEKQNGFQVQQSLPDAIN